MASTIPYTRLIVVLLSVALVGSVVALGGVAAVDQHTDDNGTDGDMADGEADENATDGDMADDEADENATDDEAAAAADPQQTTYLRVVHASPDAPAVDVLIENDTVLSNVSFGDVSDYLPGPAGTYNVTIAAAEDPDTVVFDDEVTLEARTVTTIAASGEISENGTAPFAPVAFNDNAWTPEDDMSALRVVHLSPDAPAVDITAGNGSVVIADDVEFGNASDYVTVPAGDYTAEIRPATEGNNGTVVTTVDVSLEGETAYSAWALGYLNPDEAPADTPFQVVATEDATMSVELPGDGEMDEDDEMEDENETDADADDEMEDDESDAADDADADDDGENETATDDGAGAADDAANDDECEDDS
ncbi:hypothetical protein L593_07235 [Salinarchaeum sp. Harcht-Bsk1]|uniref:DUF4397 domain-containing protein n=1 Tax=Salinarchaeum sp. Harcht-Bsk1 TaxID=1333523 RepID=UPI0003422CC5|nr:DUF4397 domain-containing protein [Salinarchaeum sp. Harcht-Bsk1]AGN01394.1 hypothetical protein L593_07235 [Salinarchaeum sp. Harcht-Bsk1]